MTRLLLLLIVGSLAATGGVSAAKPRVHPTVEPSRPTQSEQVVVRFRARETLDGVYRAEARYGPGCDAQRSHPVRAPRRGRVVRLKLSPPHVDGAPDIRRWCVGRYRATVYFKQTVRCQPPVQCGDSVEVPLGSTTFTVLAGP